MPETTLQEEVVVRAIERIERSLTLEEARDLLDWLEAQGVTGVEVQFDENERIKIRFEN